MDIHALIQEFLQQQTIHSLNNAERRNDITKAGVVPFIRKGAKLRYYLMKPVAKNPGQAAPKFQLCKGTMMVKSDNVWIDIIPSLTLLPNGGDSIESLAATALREGIEELGLKLENIKQLFDVGPYRFSSATTGKTKEMWMFAAEMAADDFSDDIAPTTADRTWLTLDEFEIVGRENHQYILRDIESKLQNE